MHNITRPYLYLALIAAFMLESAFLNLLNIAGIRPELMLILLVFIGLHCDYRLTLEAGVACGLLRGAMSTGPVIIHVATYSLCSLFAVYCSKRVYKKNFLMQIILLFFIAAAANGLNIFARSIMNSSALFNTSAQSATISYLFAISIYTAFLSPPVFFCLSKYFKFKGEDL